MHLGVNIEEAQSGVRQPLTIVRGVPLERLKELGVPTELRAPTL